MGYLIITLLLIVIWKLHEGNKQVDHTGDPSASPCPICKTASLMGTFGFTCPKCKSHWSPTGAFTAAFICGHCNSNATRIYQDPYEPSIFAIKFKCGREGHYDHKTQAKSTIKPCRGELSKQMSKPIPWKDTIENNTTTPIHSTTPTVKPKTTKVTYEHDMPAPMPEHMYDGMDTEDDYEGFDYHSNEQVVIVR